VVSPTKVRNQIQGMTVTSELVVIEIAPGLRLLLLLIVIYIIIFFRDSVVLSNGLHGAG